MRGRADQGEGSRTGQLGEGEGKESREQWREYLRSGCGGRGGGYDRDRVVEAGGGLTGDCWLTTTSETSLLAKSSGGYST